MILVGNRRPEQGHDSVTHDLVDGALIAVDSLRSSEGKHLSDQRRRQRRTDGKARRASSATGAAQQWRRRPRRQGRYRGSRLQSRTRRNTSLNAFSGDRGRTRKQVTVLFADLKGSMELRAERNPEEARKILDPVLERM